MEKVDGASISGKFSLGDVIRGLYGSRVCFIYIRFLYSQSFFYCHVANMYSKGKSRLFSAGAATVDLMLTWFPRTPAVLEPPLIETQVCMCKTGSAW